jgi:hypothetical protein
VLTGAVAAKAMISRACRRVAVSMQSGRIGGGSLRDRARRRFYLTNRGSARLSMFSILHCMLVKWARQRLCLIIPAKKLMRLLTGRRYSAHGRPNACDGEPVAGETERPFKASVKRDAVAYCAARCRTTV